MPTPAPSLNEILELLKRTNLPTVITEGKDDYTFYRSIEEELSDLGVSLYPVGGRSMLLEIFQRRKELGRNNIVFIADRDLWLYMGTPDEYQHRKLLFTDGYSIENDLYRDGEIYKFFRKHELERFNAELKELVKWYSFCVRKIIDLQDASISDHPNLIIDNNCRLNSVHMENIGYDGPDNTLFDCVMGDHERFLRGKTLIELAVRHLSHRQRDPKYGKRQIMEIGAVRRGIHLNTLVDRVTNLMTIL